MLGCLWEVVTYEVDWLTGIQISLDSTITILLCVYMPNEDVHNDDGFIENRYLGIITSLLIIDDICETITIISMTESQLFCKESNRSIIIESAIFLPCDSFT